MIDGAVRVAAASSASAAARSASIVASLSSTPAKALSTQPAARCATCGSPRARLTYARSSASNLGQRARQHGRHPRARRPRRTPPDCSR